MFQLRWSGGLLAVGDGELRVVVVSGVAGDVTCEVEDDVAWRRKVVDVGPCARAEDVIRRTLRGDIGAALSCSEGRFKSCIDD